MALSPPFALTADVQARFPNEAATLCADEQSRLPDWSRFDEAMGDVSMEMRAILAARYSAEQLGALDDDSNAVLKLFAIDMAMYRVALSFSRTNDQIKARYDNAVKRLEGIAAGRGALNPATPATLPGQSGGDLAGSTPHEAIVQIAPPDWGRRRLRYL
jgi:phage gp36-like protein